MVFFDLVYTHIVLCRHNGVFQSRLQGRVQVQFLFSILCSQNCGIIYTRFHAFYVVQEIGMSNIFYKCCGTLIWVRIDVWWRWTVSGVLSAGMFFIHMKFLYAALMCTGKDFIKQKFQTFNLLVFQKFSLPHYQIVKASRIFIE